MGFRTVLGPDAVWGAPNPVVEQAHIHFAPRGCYLARAVRQET